MAKNEKETGSVSIRVPDLESTPFKFWRKEDGQLDIATAADTDFANALKQVTGVKDSELAREILLAGGAAIEPFMKGPDGSFNIILQTLHDIQPKDAVEARLAVQAGALFAHGMSNLKRSEAAERLNHDNHYSNKAIKLLRLHNETIEALARYRRGGEQKVTVTHAVVANQAIVNNYAGGGDNTKNGGTSSCHTESAVPKLEPMSISRVDSQPCPTADVGCMEVKAVAQRQKRAKSA